jgi:hypothetical protein
MKKINHKGHEGAQGNFLPVSSVNLCGEFLALC